MTTENFLAGEDKSQTTQEGSGTAEQKGDAAPAATEGGNATTGAPPEKPAGEPSGTKPEADPKDGEKKESATAETPPADLDIKLPDGVTADPELLNAFKTEAKAAGLKSESAQKIVDAYVDAQKRAFAQADKQREEHWTKTQEKWLASVRADKEIGGENLEKNQKVAQRFLAKFFNPEISQVLIESGLGNHPELIRGCIRAGHALLEDNAGAVTGAGGTAELSADEKLARAVMPSIYVKE